MSKTYVTTYCNHPHTVSTGKPIRHECITIPPEALAAEIAGNFEKAIRIMREKRASVTPSAYATLQAGPL